MGKLTEILQDKVLGVYTEPLEKEIRQLIGEMLDLEEPYYKPKTFNSGKPLPLAEVTRATRLRIALHKELEKL